MQFFQISEWRLQGGKVPRGRLERSAQDSACWRNVRPACVSSSRTNGHSYDFQDLESPLGQRMSTSTQRDTRGTGGLEQRRKWTESSGRGLKTLKSGATTPSATLICEAHRHCWSLCKHHSTSWPGTAPASPGPAPQTVP